MRSFAWFLGLIVLALAAMAVFTYPLWSVLHPHFGFPFHRVADRIGMVALAAGFFTIARRMRLLDRASLGYGLPARRLVPEITLGFALGVASMALVVVLMVALKLRLLRTGAVLTPAALAPIALQGLLRGIAVTLIEETFLRGAMWSGIARESGARTATVLTAFVYAFSHFVGQYRIAEAQLGWHSGIDMLAGALRLFAHPLGIADAYLCLFAVGLALGAVRAATGNIAATLGLHAGFVWVITFVREISLPDARSPLAFLLSRFDGVVGWLVLGWTVPLGLLLYQFYSARTARPNPRATA
ncbi:MAG TPA: CPBP family glutamic-type intramembrane protease [Steroidobacteraceae bacterium]|nr:CPBP family glutamic-type intramembrane protease [Steroidobacteraceae bacterium]